MGGENYVLVIDDESDIRDSIQEVLEGEGYSVRLAANGADAMKILQNSPPPKLILLDLLMPVMNGAEFRRRQMLDPLLADLPVVVMSADNAAREKAAELQTEFIKKPIELNELISTARYFCK